MRRTTTLAIRVLLFCAVVIHLQATTITVTNTNDSGPGSLRQALANANTSQGENAMAKSSRSGMPNKTRRFCLVLNLPHS